MTTNVILPLPGEREKTRKQAFKGTGRQEHKLPVYTEISKTLFDESEIGGG